MRVLLVEDDSRTADFIARGLREAGFVVERAGRGEAGLALAVTGSFDVAVVDIMLPGLDGLTLVRELRRQRNALPVLLLSARSTVEDRVAGLHAGGDDYLVKPFAFSELLARVQALLRRSTATVEPTCLTVRDLTLDLLRRKVTRSESPIDLQPKEFALLEYLVRNAGRVVTRTMIMEHVWEYNFDPQTNVVEARICRLREKLERQPGEPLIRTIRGVGYVLE